MAGGKDAACSEHLHGFFVVEADVVVEGDVKFECAFRGRLETLESLVDSCTGHVLYVQRDAAGELPGVKKIHRTKFRAELSARLSKRVRRDGVGTDGDVADCQDGNAREDGSIDPIAELLFDG